MSQPKLTLAHVQEALKDVKFMDRKFIAMEKGDGFLIQMSYMEADVDNPEAGPVEQKTRKWYASPYMTESELVETCWAMVCRSQMHVAGEHFTYKGRRVYSPHFDINARIEMCDAQRFDCREPIAATNGEGVVTEYDDNCISEGDQRYICHLGTPGCSELHYPK